MTDYKDESMERSETAVHPGRILAALLRSQNMTQTRLAEKMGVKRNFVNGIINEKRNIGTKTALKLERALGVRANYWLNLQSVYNIFHEALNRYPEVPVETRQEKDPITCDNLQETFLRSLAIQLFRFDNQPMTLFQMQCVLLTKIRTAYELLRECEADFVSENMFPKQVQLTDYLNNDIKSESYKMLITNYLTELLVKGKYHNCSLFENHEVEMNAFYKEYESKMKTLRHVRNKVYAHMDKDIYSLNDTRIEYDFIETCISFIGGLLNNTKDLCES